MVDAAAWYEAQQADLGKRFLSVVQDATTRIAINPLLFPEIDGEVRRCLTHAFPFGVLFPIRPDALVVVAVMHLHREPGYWLNRRMGERDGVRTQDDETDQGPLYIGFPQPRQNLRAGGAAGSGGDG